MKKVKPEKELIILGFETKDGNFISIDELRPIINAVPRSDGVDGLMFYCPFCKKFHLHGNGEGHKIAHCINEKSLLKNGYILKESK